MAIQNKNAVAGNDWQKELDRLQGADYQPDNAPEIAPPVEAVVTLAAGVLTVAGRISPENVRITRPKTDRNGDIVKGTGGKPYVAMKFDGTGAVKSGAIMVYLTTAAAAAMAGSK